MQRTTTGSQARSWRLPRVHISLAQVSVHALLVAGSFLVLLPVLWAVSASLKGPRELFEAAPSLLIREPTLANYAYMWTRLGNVPTYFANAFIVSLGSVALVIVTASLAGYAFARMEFRGRDALFLFLVLMLFVPRSGGLMALYELMSFLHLRNSLVGLILLFGSALSVPIFIMRQTFLSLPREVEEAATIDGAGWLDIFRHIAVPLAAPGMVIVAIFTFIRVWGDFLVTLTMIDRDALMTIAVGVRKVSTGTTAFFGDSQLTGQYSTYGADAAIYLLAAAPAVLIWVVLQRWFMRGLTEGVMKF